MNWFMLLVMPRITAITLFPFGVYLHSYDVDISTIKHESVHWQQQKEMLCLFFYVWYLVEWLIKIPFCGRRAYMSISFEQEAYSNPDPRKRFGWMKYIFKCYKYL
jgi:hypothetical protein